MDLSASLAPLFAKLLEHPVIQDAIAQGMELRNNIIKTAVRFDQRFDSIETKLDKIIAAMPGEAGDDGLMKLLESANVQPCDVPDCTNTAVHDHGAGPVQKVVQFASVGIPVSIKGETNGDNSNSSSTSGDAGTGSGGN